MKDYNLKTYSFASLLAKVVNLSTSIRTTRRMRTLRLLAHDNYEDWAKSEAKAKYEYMLGQRYKYLRMLQDCCENGQFGLDEADNNKLEGCLMMVSFDKNSH